MKIVEANNRVTEQALGAKMPGSMIQPTAVSGHPNQMVQIYRVNMKHSKIVM